MRGSEEQTEQREHVPGEAEGGEAMNVITEEQIEDLMRAETRTQPADLGERKRASRKLSGYVRELRKRIYWVSNEIHCLNKARRPPVSGKLRVLRRRLIKMCGSLCLQGRRLHAISYKLKGLVRVKTVPTHNYFLSCHSGCKSEILGLQDSQQLCTQNTRASNNTLTG